MTEITRSDFHPVPDHAIKATISGRIVDQLREEIRAGRIEPGTRLRQAEVSARFNVSTTPVREAFATLEREGLLVGSAHRGVIVFQPTVDDLLETYEIRIPLEALATKLAVERFSKVELISLERIVQEMELVDGDAARYDALNTEFHATIYRAANRRKLERLIARLRAESAAYLRLWSSTSWTAADTQPQHVAIFEACRRGEPEDAAAMMTEHLSSTAAHISSELIKVQTERGF